MIHNKSGSSLNQASTGIQLMPGCGLVVLVFSYPKIKPNTINSSEPRDYVRLDNPYFYVIGCYPIRFNELTIQ